MKATTWIAALVLTLMLPAICSAASYTVTDLGTLGGPQSVAYGINDSGQVVGTSAPVGFAPRHAFLYSGGVMKDLNDLVSGGGSATLGIAYGINDSGQITGMGGPGYGAFLFSGGGVQDCGTLYGNSSRGYAINASGEVVGGSDHAFLYSGGVMQDLNSLIDPLFGWALNNAWAINNSGQIVGEGTIDGQVHAFLATPVPEPSSFVLAAFGIIGLVVWRRRKR